MDITVDCADETALVEFGAKLGMAANDGGIIYLEGILGAGKTTLSRGVLRAFGHSGAVKSPTYTLVEPYEFESHKVFHFDLYRLGDPEELEYMGIRDYFETGNLSLIEWPERGKGFLPPADLTVKVALSTRAGSTGRQLSLGALSERGNEILEQLATVSD